ncbi:hypothetical protein ACQKQC_02890 [Vibrio fortis]|uniref:hypothetical protein n=1 Tax=Vibrio fortis TaxID=212667 RepID=UPI00406870C1
MNKTLTLLTASLVALYGCGGGGSSSGSSTGNQKGPDNQTDFPIKNAQFAPKQSTTFNYEFEVDGQPEGNMSMLYAPLSADELIEHLQETPDSEALLKVVHDLRNYGVNQFYMSETIANEDIMTADYTFYFAGTDSALHEITDTYFIDSQYITTIMRSSPLFRLTGADVKESNPIIDISEETVSIQATLDGEAVINMLTDFDDHQWVKNLPANDSCSVVWQQQINETGVRKSFTVSGKSIEAANMTEKNEYYLNCDRMDDSMQFSSSSERWFNPSIGLLTQVELLNAENTVIAEEKATLTEINKAS